MTVQARPSVLVPVGLVVAQGVLFGALGAGLMAGALAALMGSTELGRLVAARAMGLRRRRTVLHGLGASHDFGRLRLRDALRVHGAGVLASGLLTLACSFGDSYLAISIAGMGLYWTGIQAAPVSATCGGDAAWALLTWFMGPIRGSDVCARLTLFGGLAGVWAGLQLGTGFLIPLSVVALHHGWQSYRSRTTEPPELLVLPGAPA